MRKRFFASLFLSYHISSMMALVLFAVLYVFVSNSVLHNAEVMATDMLTQASTATDRYLSEFASIGFYLQENPDIAEAMKIERVKPGTSTPYQIYKLCNAIPAFERSNAFVRRFRVVLRRSGYTISSGSAIQQRDALHTPAYFFGTDTDVALDELLWGQHYNERFVSFPSRTDPGCQNIYYLQHINVHGIDDGLIVLDVNPDALRAQLKGLDTTGEGLAFIVDDDGAIVSSYEGEACTADLQAVSDAIARGDAEALRTLSRSLVITESVSLQAHWTYVTALPKRVVMRDVDAIRKLMISLIALAVASTIGIALLLARRNGRTLSRIYSLVAEPQAERWIDPLRGIEGAVSRVVDSNENLMRLVEERKPLLRAALLTKLLFGEYAGAGELESIVRDLGLSGVRDRLTVALVEILPIADGHARIAWGNDPADSAQRTGFRPGDAPVGPDPLEANEHAAQHGAASDPAFADAGGMLDTAIVKSIVMGHATSPCYALDVDPRVFAALLPFPDAHGGGRESLLALFERVMKDVEGLSRPVALKVCVADASPVEEAHYAYERARTMQQRMRLKPPAVYFSADDVMDDADMYYYPFDVEYRLVQYAKRGNREDMESLFHAIYADNFVKRDLSPRMIEQLLFAIKNTMLRNLSELGDDAEIASSIRRINDSPMDFSLLNRLYQVIMRICERSAASADGGDEQKRSIAQYMRAHYTEPDFSIHHVCKAFSLGESTAYRYFKVHFEQSFFEMVENMRIDEACRLLLTRKVPIKEIAERIGYISDVSFRRAFKRKTGLSPSDYIKSMSDDAER